ncbi:MAG TPA: hypothetical protein VJ914_33965 [Pseudonocardiaceae bacterium]|nr:hypothetical protein [Pseudonocardiaceae bacterium]
MPDHWSATSIAAVLHRTVLAPLDFRRSGTTCVRTDHQLVRVIKFYARPASTPRVQILLSVAVDGLPESLAPLRRDTLWGHPEPRDGRNWYPRPSRQDPLPDDLIDDVSESAIEFLACAEDLEGFVTWAREIYAGDGHRGWWRRFRPVLPQGTSPRQAAAYAALLSGDEAVADELAAQVEASERDSDERRRFEAELAHVRALI